MTRRASVFFCLAVQGFFTMAFPAEALGAWHHVHLKADGRLHVRELPVPKEVANFKVYGDGHQARYRPGSDGCSIVARATHSALLLEGCGRFRLTWRANPGVRLGLVYR
jgi:hypothetical protein